MNATISEILNLATISAMHAITEQQGKAKSRAKFQAEGKKLKG